MYRHPLKFAVNVDIEDPASIKTAKILTLGEYCESGEDVLGNTVWVLRDWGQYHPEPRRPQAERGRVVLPPISKDEDGIPQYVRARLTVLTLLFDKLEPTLSSEIYLLYLSKQ